MPAFAIRRRTVLAGAGVAAAAAALPAGCVAFSSKPRARSVLGAPAAPSILQIVAHQDDDVLFMNPDLATALDRGIPTTTVFLTAGEAAGGAVDGSQDAMTFAGARMAGSRAAYAQMMRSADDWNREVVAAPGGQSVELATLKAAPHVKLLFMNLPDGADQAHVPDVPNAPPALAVSSLLLGHRSEIPTVVPTDGIVTAAFSYTRDQVLNTLVGFLKEFRPTILRTLDPNIAEQHWRGSQNGGGDNADHIATARLVDIALQRHLSGGAQQRIALTNYVGYGASGLPANMTSTQATAKTNVFAAYMAHDRNAQKYANSYPIYYTRRHYRWEPGSLVLAPDGTGMSAFAIINRQVVQWTCASPDGVWQGPTAIGPYGVNAVTAATHVDGRIRLFALNVNAETAVSSLTTSVQSGPNGAFGRWTSAGNPWSISNPEASADLLAGDAIGQPKAVVTPDGNVHLFVHGPDNAVFRRVLTPSRGERTVKTAEGDVLAGWKPWSKPLGTDVLDGLAPIVDAQGRVHLFAQAMQNQVDPTAPAVPRLIHWRETKGVPDLVVDPSLPGVQMAGPPVASLDSAGRIRVFYQIPDTAETAMLSQQPDGAWVSFERLTGTGGIGTPSVSAAPAVAAGLIHTAVQTPGSGVGILRQNTDLEFAHDWQDLGGFTASRPALACHADGRFTAALLGPDGRLQVAVQPRPGTDVPYGLMKTVGS